MAGKWQKTRYPGVYVQEDRYGKARYKAKFRDARGVVTSRQFKLEREAKNFLADIRIRRANNDLPDVSKGARTLTQLWEHFTKSYENKPSTFISYEARWTKHIAPALGRRRLDALKKSDIREFYTELQSRTTLETRRKVQQVLHAVLQVAVNDEWLTKNPAHGIKMPGAVVQREARALTDAEVEKLANEVPARYRALVWMLAETGARPGEILALRMKNLNGSISIKEAMAEVRGHKVTSTPKTKKSVRDIPISPKLRQALRDHFDAGFANRFDPESYVFTAERGGQIGQANLRKRILQPAAERIGIEGFTTYDLRHTAISLWLMKGLSPWTVAKMVGHTTLTMIEERYGHLIVSAAQKEIDRIAEVSTS